MDTVRKISEISEKILKFFLISVILYISCIKMKGEKLVKVTKVKKAILIFVVIIFTILYTNKTFA